MPVPTRQPRRFLYRSPRTQLLVEALEMRDVPSVSPQVVAVPNETLDQAANLGALSFGAQTQVNGIIGDGPAGAADVNWYSFQLTGPSTVHLRTLDQNGAVMSLYNNATDVFDPNVPTGHRLLGQAQGTGASLDRLLPTGTYFVAISGAGNRYFDPFLADSGATGTTGDYTLFITPAPYQTSNDGPQVLTANPANGAVLSSSPFELRLTFSNPVDFSNLVPGPGVLTLTYNPTGNFGDGNDQDVPLLANYSSSANELQLLPLSPIMGAQAVLALGDYKLSLAQDSSALPLNQDFTETFEINGIKGSTGASATADDTPATAHNLGDVTTAGLVQVAGAIGDDPAYNPDSPDPLLSNPAADVDMYHFQISGTGNNALIVQVAAGSIGYSNLDPAVSLFRVDPANGHLGLVAVNDNTLNLTQGTDGSYPLFNDAVIFAGVQAGSYYLAVSGTGNLPDPANGIAPGTNGVFDPNVSQSGTNGYTTGDYVLNLLVQPADTAPQVQAVSLQQGAVLDTAPTQFTVTFTEPVDLQQLAYTQFSLTGHAEIPAVFIRGADGVDYSPRFLSYDPATNQAVFLMLDRLPNGPAELHLSGALGLTGLGGNPLVGSNSADPTGDFIVSFTVSAPVGGSPGHPLVWLTQEPNNTLQQPQVLGVLFSHELQTGVTIRRAVAANPGSALPDTADVYQFEVLLSGTYSFTLTGSGLPGSIRPELFDAAGNPILTAGGAVPFATLDPGVYFIRVGGWSLAQSASVTYDLGITLGASSENPTPLTTGPSPAYRIRLAISNNTGGNGGNGNGGGSDGGSSSPPVVVTSTPTPTPVLVIPGTFAQGANGNIAPAVSSSSSNGTTTASGPLSNLLSLFSNLPVGGVRDTNPGNFPQIADRVVLPGVEGTPSNTPLRLASMGSKELSGVVDPSTVPSPEVLDGAQLALPKNWQRLLDLLFEQWEKLEDSSRLPEIYQEPLPLPAAPLKESPWDLITQPHDYPWNEAICQQSYAPSHLSAMDLIMTAGLTLMTTMVPLDRKKARKAIDRKYSLRSHGL